MINPQDAQTIMVDVCTTVLTTLANENKLQVQDINIRIDMENPTSTPLFALFNKSTLVKRMDLKAIVRAGGGKAFSMFIGMQVRKIIKDIFVESVKSLELNSTKDMFVLLNAKEQQTTLIPYIVLYKLGTKVDAIPITQLVGGQGM